MNPQLTVYLAGYSEEHEYRRFVKEHYGDKLNLIDPIDVSLEFDLIKKMGQNRDLYIIRRDQKLILQSDIVVAYVNIGSTFGTTMEIQFSKMNNIKVFTIEPQMKFRYDIWLKYHTDKFFLDIGSCFDFILSSENTAF